jgi:hypothetical protein
VVSQYNRSVHSTTNMTPNAAHDEENNREVFEYVTRKRRFLKKVRQGRRPPLTEGDIVKIQVPHSTVRRINIAQYGPRPYRVEAVVSDASGLQRYRVADRLFLRHELLKVKDVRRKTTDGLASIPPDSKEAGDLPGVGQMKATGFPRDTSQACQRGIVMGDCHNTVAGPTTAREEEGTTEKHHRAVHSSSGKSPY